MCDQHALLLLLLRSERTTGAWVIVNHHTYPLGTRWETNSEVLAGEILGKYIFPRNNTYPLLGRRGPESHPRGEMERDREERIWSKYRPLEAI